MQSLSKYNKGIKYLAGMPFSWYAIQLVCNLAGMQSLSKYNQGIKYLLCAIDLFSKYAWVIPIKDKKRDYYS